MNQDYVVAETLTANQMQQLMEMYHQAWWSQKRCFQDVTTILHNSHIVALLDPKQDTLIAFARFLSDGVYRAMIYDVMVAALYRGLGYGRLLLETLTGHPLLISVERIELYCQSPNVSFYEKFGFKEVSEPTHLMRRQG